MNHYVTVTFDGFTPSYDFTCKAPLDSQCHAVWDCDCDIYFDYLVADGGKPTHLPDPHDKHLWHVGRFNPDECALTDWFDEFTDESIDGVVSFEVTPEREGDNYVFHVASGRAS